jgi:hypothetical protein
MSLYVILFLFVLISGPHAKWVKRFLPNNANRIAFVVIVSPLIAGLFIMDIVIVVQGERGGYIGMALSVLCFVALYRFISDWWLKDAPERDRIRDTTITENKRESP